MRLVTLIALLISASISAHSAENRLRVAVVDTGINPTKIEADKLCADGHIDLTGHGLLDINGHGTNVAAIIAKAVDAKTECITIVKWYHGTENVIPAKTAMAIAYALITLRPRWANLSMQGTLRMEFEETALRLLVNTGNDVVVAAGNERKNLSYDCSIFPACYHINATNWHVVGNGFNELTRNAYSNYGGPVSAWADGNRITAGGVTLSGTSMSAAMHTAKLIRKTHDRK